MPGPLTVTRLLQNPLGDHAPDGERGDIVRVSDGTATVYLTPSEYEQASLHTCAASSPPESPGAEPAERHACS
jgi:hypothetical protein